MNGEIRLRPAASLTEGADASAKLNAHVSCHGYSMAVFFGLHIAYRVQTQALASDALGSEVALAAQETTADFTNGPRGLVLDWKEVKGAAQAAFNVWVSGGELQWADANAL